jgi:hypothetical protein
MMYDPLDWYWLASDGRLFASARQAIIAVSDDAYKAWLAAGNNPTPWPKDETATQTGVALQWVFDTIDAPIFVDLTSYAANARFLKETGGITVNGAAIQTDRDSQAMISNAYAYVTASGAASVSYKTASGFVTMDAATLKAVALAIGAHVQACFAIEGSVGAAIAAGSIKTTADVDAAFDAIND